MFLLLLCMPMLLLCLPLFLLLLCLSLLLLCGLHRCCPCPYTLCKHYLLPPVFLCLQSLSLHIQADTPA